jgi:hypothetical protein
MAGLSENYHSLENVPIGEFSLSEYSVPDLNFEFSDPMISQEFSDPIEFYNVEYLSEIPELKLTSPFLYSSYSFINYQDPFISTGFGQYRNFKSKLTNSLSFSYLLNHKNSTRDIGGRVDNIVYSFKN